MTKRTTDGKTDRFDLRILAALCARGRQTITELSKLVGLSQTPCSTRVEKLETDLTILGYHADVDIERLTGLSLYYVTITAKHYSHTLVRKVEALSTESPYIVAADALFGSLDYVLQIYARSAQHYHEIMAPFLELDIDYHTWPVSRRVLRQQAHRLITQFAQSPP
jgi:DNA-binding Lrp family transcriptional regulator